MTRHLLDIGHLNDDDIRSLLDRTGALARGAAPHRRYGAVANLFFEPSTRTRVSFELAARRLGLDPVNVDHSASSYSKGESLIDTARTLAAMGVRCVVLRHSLDRAAAELASQLDAIAESNLAVINAGDGQNAHPSQALLDAAVLEGQGLNWSSARIALLGDIRHSRVARSDLALFHRLGARDLRIVGPPELMPDDGDVPLARRYDQVDAALDGIDVVVCLRIQRERIAASGYPDGEAFHQDWGLTTRRTRALGEHVRIMHPGPMNRGVEIGAEVAESSRALVLEQVRHGLHLRTALFDWLIPADAPPYF